LIRVFIGRSGRDENVVLDAEDAALIALAREEVAARLGARAEPRLARVHRWPQAMPQYVMGHPARVARIEQRLDVLPGLYLAGRGFRVVGIPDCFASGERAAEAAAAGMKWAMAATGARDTG
jgi:oxygen-dependent protoporphyrinogen oxidase